eukprot:Rhum_TRINITY_DN25261_c0_g1::Rhum_TRINITY_DN25261_c0_g1_i1::g.181668::m.181668
MKEGEFIGEIEKAVGLDRAGATAVVRSGVESLAALLSLVGRGDHHERGWQPYVATQVERWYWGCRKSGTASSGFLPSANTSRPDGQPKPGRRRRPAQAASPTAAPSNGRRHGGRLDWGVTSHEHGRAYLNHPPATDGGRNFPVLDTSQPTEIGWEPPNGWAEAVRPHPVDPQLYHPPAVEQLFERPAHHSKVFARGERSRSPRYFTKRRTGRSASPRGDRTAAAGPPPQAEGLAWVDALGTDRRSTSAAGGPLPPVRGPPTPLPARDVEVHSPIFASPATDVVLATAPVQHPLPRAASPSEHRSVSPERPQQQQQQGSQHPVGILKHAARRTPMPPQQPALDGRSGAVYGSVSPDPVRRGSRSPSPDFRFGGGVHDTPSVWGSTAGAVGTPHLFI